jgi:tetratricopeptide (TPR) repeat protein
VQLSVERGTHRWLILSLVWILVACLATLDSLAVRDYVALIDASGTVAADSLPFVRPVPADYADAQTWVRYAIALDSGAPWQLRHTDIDNAPSGRDVHWNSAFAQLIAAAGRAYSASTGLPLARATEQVLAWFNLPLLIGVVLLFSTFVARRAGAAGGALTALGMLGHRWFYFGFAPNYVDHHGLLTAASFGVVLGATFMGAGWWRAGSVGASSLLPASRREVRGAALLSAIAGAFGLWLSAASVIPTIAVTGLAGLVAGWWLGLGAQRDGAELDAGSWRLWSRVGGGLALVAYLLEYAPHHFSMRLEVNHPLYALAWIGGGEVIAMLLEWRVTRRRAPAWRMTLATLALAAAPLAIAIGGARVFVPLDPRMVQLHAGIAEFFSLALFAHTFGAVSLGRFAIGFVLALPVLLLLRRQQRDRLLLAFLSVVVLSYVALASWQIRWWLGASGSELCLLLAAVAALTAHWTARSRWLVVLVLCGIFAEQSAARIIVTREQVHTATVTPADAMEPLYRDVAATIRSSQPRGDIVLLTNPNASTAIGYFGGFRTLGTLYWENTAGLAAAASIFSARTDEEARALMRAHGVTHVAMLSKDDFLRAYFELAEPGAPSDAITGTFGYRLLIKGAVPRWLRPIPFRVRRGAPSSVVLLQVVPDQSDVDALWNAGIARIAIGSTAEGEDALRRAIALAPADRRAALYEDAAGAAYRWDAHAAALRLYRSAMSLAPTPTTGVNIAWILATSADGQVRDGLAALVIVEPLATAHPKDPTILDVYAAALAEAGRFPEAQAIADRITAIAQFLGDSALETRAARRIESYRAGRPWRQ